ncbi:MAG: DNA polymerase III subunit gamma/tau [Proteobacteria bacterium]|nr:DNA polymerase III subunit gamma/tau [Pseudomonadota bacterium]
MSYQVLARKWRPKTFEDMVGQGHVLQTLTNALDNDRLHHAYLFTGTRGVGKTTLARILAKCLNCEQGVSSTPCGECSACVSIDEGRFVDLIEVDAASRAKVDETRDLMDNVQYAPSVGRYKVYLIDEVHMFSGHSFNALLKTLEEPPPHVKFLLATTEAKKIPVTILSRCLQFNLKHLSVEQIETQLEKILKLESIESDANSRKLIAKSADGSLRDALSLLDQAIAYGNGRLQEAQVRAMLGTIDSLDLKKLLEALISGDAQSVLQCADHLAEHNPDYDSVLVELLSTLQKIAICQVLDSDDVEQDEMIKELSQRISQEDVQLYYQMGILGRKDLPVAPDPRSGFEMTLIRMLAFRPAAVANTDAGDVGGTINNVKKNEAGKDKTRKNEIGENDSIQAEQSIRTDENTGTEIRDISQANVASDATNWQSIIDEMALVGLVKELAGHCALKGHSEGKVHLVLSPDKEHLLNQTQKERLSNALELRFGKGTQLKISIEEPEAETPAQKKAREEREKQKTAESSIKGDANVQAMEEIFGATLDEKSIRPV